MDFPCTAFHSRTYYGGMKYYPDRINGSLSPWSVPELRPRIGVPLFYALSVLLFLAAPARAALFQGTVKEARYGVGVDSVKVRLAGSDAAVYSDSAGRFSYSTAAISPRGPRPEVLWLAKTKTIAWSGIRGTVSIRVSDAKGRVERRFESGPDQAGRFRAAGLAPGIRFISVRAMGRSLSWIWYDLEGAASAPGGINRGASAQARLPGGNDAAYILDVPDVPEALAKRQGPAKTGTGASAGSGAASDTLIFERKGFATLALPVTGSETALDPKLARAPIRVLIIDGMNNHDWRQTTKVVKAIYASSGFFSVDVSTAPATTNAAAWQAWNPRFKDYEAVVMNYNSGDKQGSLRWPLAKEIELQDFVKDGGGLYALHAGNNSFPDWAEYNRMIAVGWRTKDFGYAIQVDSLGAPKRIAPGTGTETSHGNRADVPIRLVNAHPIHKGFPHVVMAAGLEIYQYARGPAEDFEVISYAFDGPASGGSNAYWPIELMITYGKGKVYNSTMGHLWSGEIQPNGVKDAAFQTTLIRATEWLARREVFQPVPSAFNTASKIVYQDLVLP